MILPSVMSQICSLRFEKIILCISVVLSLLLMQCGTGTNEQNINVKVAHSIKESEVTQVNFIGQWLNEGVREDLVRNVARSYEFEHQDVRINLKFPEEVYYKREDMFSNQRFVAEEVQKEVGYWDILRINGEMEVIAEFAKDPEWAAKYLVDFSEMDEYKKHTLPALLTDSVKVRWNGILPGPFVEGSYWAFWCNQKVAQKVGIEVKQYGMTFNDFEQYIAAVYNYNQKNPNDKIGAIFESGEWKTVHAFAIQLFSTVLNDESEFFSNKTTEKKLKAWHETLRLLERLAKYKPIAQNWKEISWSKTLEDMLDEKYLFYSNGSWMYNIWSQKDAEKVKNCFPVEYPCVNKATTTQSTYIIMWAVPKNAPHKEEAIKFLLSLNKPSFSEMWVRYTKCPTGVTGNLTDVKFGSDKVENFSSYIQETYGTHAFLQEDNYSRALGLNNIKVPGYVHEVLMGELTADEAMRKIRNQLR